MEQLDRIEHKLDGLKDKFAEMGNVQVAQAKDLEYHIKRTSQVEEHIKLLEEQIKPLTTNKAKVDGAMKLLGYSGSIAAAIGGLLKWLGIIH